MFDGRQKMKKKIVNLFLFIIIASFLYNGLEIEISANMGGKRCIELDRDVIYGSEGLAYEWEVGPRIRS